MSRSAVSLTVLSSEVSNPCGSRAFSRCVRQSPITFDGQPEAARALDAGYAHRSGAGAMTFDSRAVHELVSTATSSRWSEFAGKLDELIALG
jgi:hypothetical protein